MEMSIFNKVSSLVARLGRCRAIIAHPKLLAPLDSRQEAGMGQSRATSFNLQMLHWNSEGVRNKNLKTPKFF